MSFTVTPACVGCGACLATCPEAAFRVRPGTPPLVVLADRCTGCAECAEVCPVEACVPVGGWAASQTPPVGGPSGGGWAASQTPPVGGPSGRWPW